MGTIDSLLAGHVSFRCTSVDRIGIRGYVPGLQYEGGVVKFLLKRGFPIPSPAALNRNHERLVSELDALVSSAAVPLVRVNGCCAPRSPNTSNLVFPHVEAEALVISLDLQGIACSAGAACSSGTVEPSHVLTAIGLGRADARASVRFSLGRFTSAQEIDYALDVIPRAVQRLRSLSPTWRDAVVA